ncbi:MAG TPA: MFS transporter [Rhizomicrobium sp.]|nr:MFS transporter [Rhizomicrobium sp.]
MSNFPYDPEDGGGRARALAERMLRAVAETEAQRALAILFVSLICMGAGQSVMFAILPTLVRRLGLTEFQGSLPFVASATIWLFSSSYWGGKSDKWGRKPVILLGLIAFGISFGSFAVIADLGIHGILAIAICYPLMIAARMIYGIFGSGTSPSAQAYIADRTTREERTGGVATLSAAFGLGTTIGPGIGSALVVFGLFAPFYFVSAVAFASAATVWYLLREETKPHIHAAEKQRLKWHDRRIWPFIVFGVGISTAGAVPIQTIGYLFIDVLHYTPKEAPQYTGIGLVAGAVAAMFAQLVVVQRFKLSARTLMRWGGAICIVSFALFAIGRQFGPLVFALMINGLGFGMVRPGYAAAASLSVDPHEQGAIAGLTGATAGAGFIFGPMLATGLYRISPSAPFLFGGGLMLICYLYAMFSPHLKNAGLVAPDEKQIEAADEIPNA